ncbi:MAG: ATP-binding cassette domain-containing protein [Actinomycetales bacterium]|nr:ATP-binding cassette domain-containing protein [Actinomycetales bacterium]
MSPSTPALIRAHGLTKSYGDRHVLQDVDLTLPHGIHALLGPNGAGKTTLIKILSTLIPRDGGELQVLGLDPARGRRALQSRISLTGQFAAVDGTLSALENLEMLGRLFGLDATTARVRGRELLERFELAEFQRTRTSSLSGGMRRKLDIAAGLMSRPHLVFLDEPTTGLDTRSRRVLWEELRTLAEQGTSILLTTQYLEEADALAQQIRVLHEGRIVAGGTAEELKRLVGGTVLRVTGDGGEVLEEIATTGTSEDLAVHLVEVASRLPRADIALHRPTLDEVFLQLTGHTAVSSESAPPHPTAPLHI